MRRRRKNKKKARNSTAENISECTFLNKLVGILQINYIYRVKL